MKPFTSRIFDNVPAWVSAIVGVWLLAFLYLGVRWARFEEARLTPSLKLLEQQDKMVGDSLLNWQPLRELKKQDLWSFKSGLQTTAADKKTFYQMGIDLHEEKRLLDKQWDIIVTSLIFDSTSQALILEKDDVPIERVFVAESSPLIFQSTVPTNPPLTVPAKCRITSKERFAHPERGSAVMMDGVLQWTPPQVGNSVRSNALGEYVIFTNSALILHGPPKNAASHEAYPHACLTLSLKDAKNLYQKTYIGTIIQLREK